MDDRGEHVAVAAATHGLAGGSADSRASGAVRPFVLQWRSAVLNSQTDATCKLVLLVLAEFADATGGNCWPSITSVSELAGVNERTTRRALDRATRAGWIERATRAVRGQAWRLYHYRLTLPRGAVTESARTRKGPGTESEPFDQTCGLSRPKVRTLTTEGAGTESDELASDLGTAPRGEQEQPVANAPVADAPVRVNKAVSAADRFPEFKSIYPRKENMAKASKVWQARNLDAVADQIIAAVAARVAGDPGWSDPRYIPHPTTYLNGARWEDQWSPAARQRDTSAVGRVEQAIRERNREITKQWAANANFHDKAYVGTPVTELPASLRTAVEAELRKVPSEQKGADADAGRYRSAAK